MSKQKLEYLYKVEWKNIIKVKVVKETPKYITLRWDYWKQEKSAVLWLIYFIDFDWALENLKKDLEEQRSYISSIQKKLQEEKVLAENMNFAIIEYIKNWEL